MKLICKWTDWTLSRKVSQSTSKLCGLTLGLSRWKLDNVALCKCWPNSLKGNHGHWPFIHLCQQPFGWMIFSLYCQIILFLQRKVTSWDNLYCKTFVVYHFSHFFANMYTIEKFPTNSALLKHQNQILNTKHTSSYRYVSSLHNIDCSILFKGVPGVHHFGRLFSFSG